MKKLSLLVMLVLLAGCATTPAVPVLTPRQILENQLTVCVGTMKYDDAISRWGQPVKTTDGDSVFVAEWEKQSTSQTTLFGQGAMVTVPVNSGYSMKLTFDKESRLLTHWNYTDW